MVTSARSSVIKEKLANLGMIEGDDFLLQDILQQDLTHGGSNKKQYFLTPESFKKCLMRAKRHGQSIDPTMYCDYYILLEKIYKLYSIYQKSYDEKMLSIKDAKIDKQSTKIDELKDLVNGQSKKMDEQSEQIRQLLGHTIEVKEDNKIVKTELVEVKTELVEVKTKLVKTNEKLVETNEKLDVTNTELVKANAKIDKVDKNVSYFGNLLKSGFEFLTNQVENLTNAFMKMDNRAAMSNHFDIVKDINKVKFQYVLKTLKQSNKYGDKVELFVCCTNKANIKKRLQDITSGTRRIVDYAIIGISIQEINFELSNLDGFEYMNKNTKSMKFKSEEFDQSIMDNLVRELRDLHLYNYGDSNELVEYMKSKNRELVKETAKQVHEIFDLFIVDGKPVGDLRGKTGKAINDKLKNLKIVVCENRVTPELVSEWVDKFGLTAVMANAKKLLSSLSG